MLIQTQCESRLSSTVPIILSSLRETAVPCFAFRRWLAGAVFFFQDSFEDGSQDSFQDGFQDDLRLERGAEPIILDFGTVFGAFMGPNGVI